MCIKYPQCTVLVHPLYSSNSKMPPMTYYFSYDVSNDINVTGILFMFIHLIKNKQPNVKLNILLQNK